MIFLSHSKRCCFESKAGFTLLGVVFAIFMLSIVSITVSFLLTTSASTRQARETMNKAAVLRAAINAYVLNHGGASGTNPPTLSSLVTTDGVACTTDNTAAHSTYLTLQGWCGPYIDQIFTQALNDYETDGWGTLFQYNNSTAVIKSCGPNRTCGDSDDISFSP